jgi:hypothetical protein
MLKKYPVIGSLGEYKVTVYREYVCLGLWRWMAKVYKYYPNKRIFKDKLIHKYETGWSQYKELMGKYIYLASEAVKDYESNISEDETLLVNHHKGIEEFNKWDGKIQ